VGIAASGVTPFVHGAFRAAKIKKLKTILVTCNPSMKINSLMNCVIAPYVGPEVITGSTRLKAGTATKLVLNMLTVTSMIQLGKVYKNWMVDLQPKSKKLVFRGLRLIEILGGVSPQKAENLFKTSQRKVKPAILMAKQNCDYKTALAKLKRSNGFLKRALSS
jgi:N-acetylmuramic acid 6-phosphate etherase